MTLTLSLAYLSVLAHQRNREHQSQVLRHQALVLQSLVDPLPPLPPPTRSEVAIAQRTRAVEVAKDRWNQEVENAVRWVQHTDWVEVREGLEDSVWRLLGKSPEDAARDAKRKAEPLLRGGARELEQTSSEVASAAKGAFWQAKTEGQKAEAKGKGAILSALERGKDVALEKGQELYGSAMSAAGIAEKRLEGPNAVQKALEQRYQKPEAKANKTVAEALKERYTPMDQRDNSVLRGV